MSIQFTAQVVRDALRNQKKTNALAAVKGLPSVDLADILALLKPEQAWFMLQNIPQSAEVFAYFDAERQTLLASQAPQDGLVPLMEAMAADERADFFKRLDSQQQALLLPALAQAERENMRKLASYEEGTAGALMTSDYATLAADITVADALIALRQEAPDAETIYHAYVLDSSRRILGVVTLRQLILAQPEVRVEELMRKEVINADVNTSQEEVARLIARYDLLALPITNGGEQLVGIVTHDDAMDAASAEATDDIHKGAAVTTIVGNLKEASISLLYRKRVFWLVLLVFGNIFSGMGIANFEEIIEANLVLVFFLPLLVDSGGNAGSQSATLMVRALATGEVFLKDWFKLLGRESLVAMALGITMAAAVSIIGWYRGGMEIALVVSLSMIAIVLIGCLIGMSLPFLLSRFKIDPASASAPLITSICDASGVVIYLYIATQFLHLVV